MPETQSIHEFNLGIDPSDLGCVMLPVAPFDGVAIDPTDLYVSPDPKKFWIKGDVARNGAHVTLLYGLLQPAWLQPGNIAKVMAGWDRPTTLITDYVDVFPSPYPDEPYGCIVARLVLDGALADAHARLSYLPHVDTFPTYQPHITLAYVKADRARDWADLLNLNSPFFDVTDGLDLGSDHA